MAIVVQHQPTEIRSLAARAGRGIRNEREQEIALREEQNRRADEAIALQQRQQLFAESATQFNQNLALQRLQQEDDVNEFNNALDVVQEQRLARNVDSQIKRRNEQTAIEEIARIQKERENDESRRRFEQTQTATQGRFDAGQAGIEDRFNRTQKALADEKEKARAEKEIIRLRADQARAKEAEMKSGFVNELVQSGNIPPNMAPAARAGARVVPNSALFPFLKSISDSAKDPEGKREIQRRIQNLIATDIEVDEDRIEVDQKSGEFSDEEIISRRRQNINRKSLLSISKPPSWEGTFEDFEQIHNVDLRSRYTDVAGSRIIDALRPQIVEELETGILHNTTFGIFGGGTEKQINEALKIRMLTPEIQSKITDDTNSLISEGGWITGP